MGRRDEFSSVTGLSLWLSRVSPNSAEESSSLSLIDDEVLLCAVNRGADVAQYACDRPLRWGSRPQHSSLTVTKQCTHSEDTPQGAEHKCYITCSDHLSNTLNGVITTQQRLSRTVTLHF